MGRNGGNRLIGAAVVLGVVVIAAGCSNASSTGTTTTTGSSTGATTGTTSPPAAGTGISLPAGAPVDVAVIETKTGSLAGYFNGLGPGMQAYFNMINAQGGINGHKFVLTADLDDGGSPSQFTQQVHTAIDQDHVFAVGVASAWFTPGYFVSTGTPTYGYNVSSNWATAPNLFAAGGSTQFYAPGVPSLGYVIKKTHSNSVAVISYGQSIASSYDACNAFASDLKAAGYNISFLDVSAQLSGSYASDVQRMQQAGSDFLVSCMQASDDITLSRDIQQYGLKVKQYWLNGYTQTLLSQYSSLMQGVYLNINGNVPFDAGTNPAFGNTYPGMKAYLTEMNKYEPTFTYNGVATQGWQSAALLVAGVKAAGSDLTQANVVAQTNKITDFTGGGITTVTNWKIVHTGFTEPNCTATVQVKGNAFVTVFAPKPQVFTCVGPNAKNPVPVAPPTGTPGAPGT